MTSDLQALTSEAHLGLSLRRASLRLRRRPVRGAAALAARPHRDAVGGGRPIVGAVAGGLLSMCILSTRMIQVFPFG